MGSCLCHSDGTKCHSYRITCPLPSLSEYTLHASGFYLSEGGITQFYSEIRPWTTVPGVSIVLTLQVQLNSDTCSSSFQEPVRSGI